MSFQEKLTRRRLPHWFMPGAFHFVTYRLAGTIPQPVLDAMKARKTELLRTKALSRERIHKQFFASFDEYLDNNRSLEWLAKPPIAAMIRENLYHHNGSLYHLLAFCIMPNHVHVLLRPCEDIAKPPEDLAGEEISDEVSPLASIMHNLKGYTAHRANKLLKRSGMFWQHESYDHWVRDEDELERIVAYICGNPVKAGLVAYAHEWYWCSAHDRFLADGSTDGFLPIGEEEPRP